MRINVEGDKGLIVSIFQNIASVFSITRGVSGRVMHSGRTVVVGLNIVLLGLAGQTLWGQSNVPPAPRTDLSVISDELSALRTDIQALEQTQKEIQRNPLLVFSAALSARSVSPETDLDQLAELRRNINSLQQGQKKIEKDLSAVLDILTGKKPPLEDVFVAVAGSPSLGASDARVTIVEFTDFQCPFCAAYANDTFARIVRDYVDAGKVRYVIRNFPLEQAHPLARKAAEAGLCAQDQGKFWALHDRFFADQTKLSPSDLPEHATAIGADLAMLLRCVETGKYAGKLANDLAEGRDLQVHGTPTFFVGYSDPANPSRIRALRLISGDVPYQNFQKAIAEALEVSQQGPAGEK